LKLSGSERNRYAKIIDKNYKIIINENDISSLGVIQKAFTFFEDNMYGDIATYYMDTANSLYKRLLEMEDEVVAGYNSLAETVESEKARILEIMDQGTAVSPKVKAELARTKNKIDSEMKRLETTNQDIKNGRQVIAAMIDPKASQDETFKIESATRDSVREYGELYTAFEESQPQG
jgi:hypothetical protein